MHRNLLAPKRPKIEPPSPEVAAHQAAIAAGKEREYWLGKGYHPEDVDWFLREMERRKQETKA